MKPMIRYCALLMPTLNYQTPPPPRDWQSYLWDRNAGEWLVWAVLFYLSSILIGESRWALRYVIVGRLVSIRHRVRKVAPSESETQLEVELTGGQRIRLGFNAIGVVELP